MLQSVFQLVRRYRGTDYTRVATAYAKSAAERMELWSGIDDGRRLSPALVTLEEAKTMARMYPRPEEKWKSTHD